MQRFAGWLAQFCDKMWNFQFKIPTRSVHMRGFSLQICALETTCKPLCEAMRYHSSEQPDENCVFLSEDFENDAEPLFRAPFFTDCKRWSLFMDYWNGLIEMPFDL